MNYETPVNGSDSRPYSSARTTDLGAANPDDAAERRTSRRRLVLILLIVAAAIAGFFAWRSFGAESAPAADRQSQLPTV
ncbi:MAG: hypothetical protein MK010_11760, partial [Erythrobacter sp.]|nr:hypothetical protein [Erythrobacter sp.]